MSEIESEYKKCSICKKDMYIEDQHRENLGLPMDSHLDCLLKQPKLEKVE